MKNIVAFSDLSSFPVKLVKCIVYKLKLRNSCLLKSNTVKL